MDSSVATSDTKLLPCRSLIWGMNSLQKFQIAGIGSNDRMGAAGKKSVSSHVGRPKYVRCGGTQDAQTVLVCRLRHTAGYSSAQHSQLPWGAPGAVFADGESECHSATPGRLCPEPRNVKQMSASGIFPGLE